MPMPFLFLLLWVSPPGPSRVTNDPSYARSLIEDPQFGVMEVTILAAEVVEGTRGDPPRGSLRVTEVLRGGLVLGEYRYVLLSQKLPEQGPSWAAEPLEGPRTGDQLVVFGGQPVAEGGKLVLQGPLIEAGEDQKTWIKAHLVRNSRALVPLFWIVVLSPALGFLPKVRWVSPLICVLAYGSYEVLMNPVYNIRIDLLLLWPALVASLFTPLLGRMLSRR